MAGAHCVTALPISFRIAYQKQLLFALATLDVPISGLFADSEGRNHPDAVISTKYMCITRYYIYVINSTDQSHRHCLVTKIGVN
jgi:hypothetical protein